jgi:CHAT domain-containing protein
MSGWLWVALAVAGVALLPLLARAFLSRGSRRARGVGGVWRYGGKQIRGSRIESSKIGSIGSPAPTERPYSPAPYVSPAAGAPGEAEPATPAHEAEAEAEPSAPAWEAPGAPPEGGAPGVSPSSVPPWGVPVEAELSGSAWPAASEVPSGSAWSAPSEEPPAPAAAHREEETLAIEPEPLPSPAPYVPAERAGGDVARRIRGDPAGITTSFDRRPPSPRFVDVTLFGDKAGSKGPRLESDAWLQVNTWYQLEVAVRQTPTGLARDEALEPFKDPQKDTTLLVALDPEDEDAVEIQELVQPLALPASGDSTKNAIFRLRPKRADPSGSTLSCKVRVYYLLNLVEVGIVTFHVLPAFADPRTSPGATVYEQRRQERDLGDLKEVQPRDLAIDVTRDAKGYRLTFTFDGTARLTAGVSLPTADLEDSLVRIRDALTDVATSPKFKTQLSAANLDFQADLRRLAAVGRRLWVKLFKRPGTALGTLGGFLENNQISTDALVSITVEQGATDFVFPWSLLYDREIPDLPNPVDPNGFWGVRYRIEQRIPIIGAEDRVFTTASPITLDFVFNNTFNNSALQVDLMTELVSSAKGKLLVTMPPFDDAEKYKERLEEGKAEILYFYCHGFARSRLSDTVASGVLKRIADRLQETPLPENEQHVFAPLLAPRGNPDEDRSWIEPTVSKLYLDELEDLNPSLVSQPLVILNLCESAQVSPSLSESFVQFFLSHGATTVIGTECVMTTAFAHPFSEQLLKGILAGRDVGQVLLEARRYFMDRKNPLGLAYTLYGSAATKLQRAIA